MAPAWYWWGDLRVREFDVARCRRDTSELGRDEECGAPNRSRRQHLRGTSIGDTSAVDGIRCELGLVRDQDGDPPAVTVSISDGTLQTTMWVALLPVAYLLGTFPSAILVARAHGVDIATVGSGNPGASNVTRVLGWRRGMLVFALDGTKGAIAAGIGLWVDGRGAAYALGAAAIVGHVFPITRRFRGGKGVATGVGIVAVLHPIIAAVTCVLWVAISRFTGKAAVASIVGVAAVPVCFVVLGVPAWELTMTVVLCMLIMARHLGNVRRLWRREEHRLSTHRQRA